MYVEFDTSLVYEMKKNTPQTIIKFLNNMMNSNDLKLFGILPKHYED